MPITDLDNDWIESYCQWWQEHLVQSSTSTKTTIEPAVERLYKRWSLGCEKPLVVFCPTPWDAMVVPLLIDTLFRFSTSETISLYLKSDLRKRLDSQLQVQWANAWLCTHAAIEENPEAIKPLFSGGSARSPLGVCLNDEFQKRLQRLDARLEKETERLVGQDFSHQLKEKLVQSLANEWQAGRQAFLTLIPATIKRLLSNEDALLVKQYPDSYLGGISKEIWYQFDYQKRSALAARFDVKGADEFSSNLDRGLTGAISDKAKAGLKNEVTAFASAFQWLENLPEPLFEQCVRCYWSDYKWNTRSNAELADCMLLYYAFGFSFYENVCFLCQPPKRITAGTSGRQTFFWSASFELKGEQGEAAQHERSATKSTRAADLVAPRKPLAAKVESSKTASVPGSLKASDIKTKLDEDVIGQSDAKRVMSVAISNHFKRVNQPVTDTTQLRKSNVLMIGPSGTGKTLMVEIMAKLIDVPFIVVDATTLTQTGYFGDSAEDLIKKLYYAAGRDVKQTERGIIYIDEIDKLRTQGFERDIKGRGVQECLLKVAEGALVTIKDGPKDVRISTENILFIGGGAFMGFKKGWSKKTINSVSTEDLVDFGMLPEFVARFPTIAVFVPLKKEELCLILTEPKNAVLKQYKKLLAMDGTNAEFTAEAVQAIAQKALDLGTGARALRSIVDSLMLDIMFNASSGLDNADVIITAPMVEAGRVAENREEVVTFAEVAGNDEAKADLLDIVRAIRNPSLWKKLKADMPKGILLSGEPGNGKTLLAKALAGECGANFLSVNASSFVEIWVGQGAQHVRELFAKAREKAPCVVFIDEIDAVGSRRSANPSSGGHEYDQTLDALLVELDGFESSEGIVVIGATNRPDVLDPALVRPGRFDRRVVVQPPTAAARKRIFEINLRDRALESGLDREWLLTHLSERTGAQTGAFCAAVIKEAGLLSARRTADWVELAVREGMSEEDILKSLDFGIRKADFDEAIDKVEFGTLNEASEASRSVQDKRNTAVHEVGHALVVTLLEACQYRVSKVTILSRADHLGFMQRIPKSGEHIISSTSDQLEADIMVSLGGRCAVELVLNRVDTGPSSDYQSAFRTARQYVLRYGMSKLGILALDPEKAPSEEFSSAIDREVRDLVARMKEQTDELLRPRIAFINELADRLLAQDTILSDDWYKAVEAHGKQQL